MWLFLATCLTLQGSVLKPDVLWHWRCRPLPVGNQLLVFLCWSWCTAVPVRKGRRHLHWEGSCRFIFFPVKCLFFTATSSSLYELCLERFSSKRGQLCHFSFVCLRVSLVKSDWRGLALTSYVYLYSTFRIVFLQFSEDSYWLVLVV